MSVNNVPFEGPLSNDAVEFVELGGFGVSVQVDDPSKGVVSITISKVVDGSALWDVIDFSQLVGTSNSSAMNGPISGIRIVAGSGVTINVVVREHAL